ncbi:bifunctional tetrahydrofolate synthase/dihydrofolate synthase [Actinokineospora sp. G85]|uniref:bifunctional tetrahydrofolate synthase/dihydrofolate synthase n=1 Tax=Actinokineospora sp. G85 TaxID=3406626 RepID=UPI003C739AE9
MVDPGALADLRQVESELDSRWSETRIDPTLDRVRALLDVLADPQLAYPVIQVAGTNGKTSVTRLVDALLTALGVRTGRFTSPHLQLVTERISLDNAPIDPVRYVEVYRDIEPYLAMVDNAAPDDGAGGEGVRLSKFEVLTAMAFAAFADTPVDVAVVETGMGGTWDATSAVDPRIAVITPIGLDHQGMLGPDVVAIAGQKAGIIKPGSIALLAEQDAEVAAVLLERAAEVDATVARQGLEFGVLRRDVAVGGQVLRLQGLGGVYDEVFLPVHGEHQAKNAALALAAVEAFLGAGADKQLDVDAIREGFASAALPGRLERVRTAPSVFVDAAHNPHGAAALAAALDDEFGFRKLVGVVSVLSDKDAAGILAPLEPVLSDIVVTANSSPRAMDPDRLTEIAVELFGDDRVTTAPHLVEAIEAAVALAETSDNPSEPLSGAGVVATGSVVTAGEVRALFGKEPA